MPSRNKCPDCGSENAVSKIVAWDMATKPQDKVIKEYVKSVYAAVETLMSERRAIEYSDDVQRRTTDRLKTIREMLRIPP